MPGDPALVPLDAGGDEMIDGSDVSDGAGGAQLAPTSAAKASETTNLRFRRPVITPAARRQNPPLRAGTPARARRD